MKYLGIPASDGIGFGRVVKLEKKELPQGMDSTGKSLETTKLMDGIKETRMAMESMMEKLHGDKHDILKAHLLMLEDPEYLGEIQAYIAKGDSAYDGVLQATKDFCDLFKALPDPYMQERAADMEDVGRRLLQQIAGISPIDLTGLPKGTILVAKDLTPSETAQLDPRAIAAFVTATGGPTSHSAIMARSMGLPAVVGLGDQIEKIVDGSEVIVDGSQGQVLSSISPAEKAVYLKKIEDQKHHQVLLQKYKDQKTQLASGKIIELAGNIGGPKDLPFVLEQGADGIGLFRTEFLFMDRMSPPSEEEQFKAYKAVLEGMEGKPVIIRTLDIGGDKEVPYMKLPHELNPFLGYRAIRICLQEQALFVTQLRAILKASTFGQVRIMFPMISDLHELRRAKDILSQVHRELEEEGYDLSSTYEVGIMIEVPSAAMIADLLAKEVDFFSIGTNDLTQYMTAVDRMNEQLSDLYNPYNLGVVRMIDRVIKAGHEQGIWVGMCGEMAGNPLYIPMLIGMGIDELSMSAGSILKNRALIASLDEAACIDLANQVLTAENVLSLLKEFH